VVEGILAEMGYRVWYQMLKSNSLMPGIVEGISLVQRDESRHIAYGVFVLSRLVAEHGKPIIDAVNAKMSELTADLLRFADPTAQQSLIGMIFPGLAEGEMPTPEKMPFHMDVNELMDIMMSYLTTASNARLTKVEKSLGRPVDEIIFRQPTMAEETAEAPATD
jgi:ribonucleoside-diphosphate reductase beta chain